jgi:hypothetical protein
MIQTFVIHNNGENAHNRDDKECVPMGIYSREDDKRFYFTAPKYNYDTDQIEMIEYSVLKQDIRCHNWDDNGLGLYPVSWTKEIDIHSISLSHFLDANYFYSHVLYRLADTLNLYSSCEMDNIYFLYKRHGIEYTLRIIDLLKYSGKSNFTNSLKSQVLTWLCVEDTEHKYTKPLSDKQFISMTKFDRENIIRRSRYGNDY